MKVLLNKSNDNFSACDLLIESEYFSSSVHCAYYGCIQLMKHIMFNVFGIDESEFDSRPEIKSNGSHNYIFNCFKNELHKKNLNISDFDKIISDIKKIRNNADYKQIVIFKRDSEKALKFAKEIKSILLIEFPI